MIPVVPCFQSTQTNTNNKTSTHGNTSTVCLFVQNNKQANQSASLYQSQLLEQQNVQHSTFTLALLLETKINCWWLELLVTERKELQCCTEDLKKEGRCSLTKAKSLFHIKRVYKCMGIKTNSKLIVLQFWNKKPPWKLTGSRKSACTHTHIYKQKWLYFLSDQAWFMVLVSTLVWAYNYVRQIKPATVLIMYVSLLNNWIKLQEIFSNIACNMPLWWLHPDLSKLA